MEWVYKMCWTSLRGTAWSKETSALGTQNSAHPHSIYSCSSQVLSCYNLKSVPWQNVKYGMIDRKAASLSLILQHFVSDENVSFRFISSSSETRWNILKRPNSESRFPLRLFGLSRKIYVNYIHISCMISTITLIITAVMRATQDGNAWSGENLNLLEEESVLQLLPHFVLLGSETSGTWTSFVFTSQRLKGFSWKWFALLGRLKMKHYRFLIHPLCSRSEYIPGRKTSTLPVSIQSFQSPIYCKRI